MKNNKSARLMFFSVTVMLLVAIVALSGCDILHKGYTTQKSPEGYISLTVDNELAHYFIEYPAYYDRAGPRLDMDWLAPFTSVELLAPKKHRDIIIPDPPKNKVKTVSAEYVPASILVYIFDPSKNDYFSYSHASGEYILHSYTSKTFAENVLSGEAKWEHFKLMERSPVMVSGIEGEMIVYETDWSLFGTKLQYVRMVLFDYDGLIWRITGKAEMELVDQMKADFDHVLETFKILGKREPES